MNAFGGGTFRSPPIPHRPAPKPSDSHSRPNPDRKAPDLPKGPNGCFRAMINGVCDKQGCGFDHTVPVLDATREDLQNKISKRLYAAKRLNAVSFPDSALDPPSGGKV